MPDVDLGRTAPETDPSMWRLLHPRCGDVRVHYPDYPDKGYGLRAYRRGGNLYYDLGTIYNREIAEFIATQLTMRIAMEGNSD